VTRHLLLLIPLSACDAFSVNRESTQSTTGSTSASGTSWTSDCDDGVSSPAPDGTSCITESLACGETISGHLSGGSQSLSGDDYGSDWACGSVGTDTYTGTERMFSFEHPGGSTTAVISLDSPCGDLDLFTAHWEDEGDCLRSGVAIGECDSSTAGGSSDQIDIWNSEARRYVVVVDTPGGDELPFTLSADCD